MRPLGVPTLLGIRYDASSSFLRGSAEAPIRIREALRSPASSLYAEHGLDLGAPGALDDAGDLEFGDGDAADRAMLAAGARTRIEAAVRALLADGRFPLLLGGDHSISYPALRAMRQSHPRLTVLHLDAHPDLYDEFDGDRFSHASPFARVMEDGLADRLVQVGIRALAGHQREQAERFGVEVVDMRAWHAGIRPRALDGPIYVSLDVDALDPAFAPGVSHREPGGLSVRDVLHLLQSLPPSVVGADLVEYNPGRDVDGLTAPVAAKLVKELAAGMLRAG